MMPGRLRDGKGGGQATPPRHTRHIANIARKQMWVNPVDNEIGSQGTAMFRTAIALAAVAAFAIAYVTGPARSAAHPACGSAIAKIMDPGLRASFAAFEAQQSAGASKVCSASRIAG